MKIIKPQREVFSEALPSMTFSAKMTANGTKMRSDHNFCVCGPILKILFFPESCVLVASLGDFSKADFGHLTYFFQGVDGESRI